MFSETGGVRRHGTHKAEAAVCAGCPLPREARVPQCRALGPLPRESRVQEGRAPGRCRRGAAVAGVGRRVLCDCGERPQVIGRPRPQTSRGRHPGVSGPRESLPTRHQRSLLIPLVSHRGVAGFEGATPSNC